ncbi:6-pyruvoyl trahydropterin synthase family protein [Planobacterium oryzisoli]|uniref:6-carboxy-5,6,7,8-tetrahydropterin synthase n=1 Tax=Planobacterium oryzisoli TaxID=2771435 RepID=A0A930YVV6_9FLAO|nr:6-carboxytetrahydropterin synthase [Planobacterium oryzisoli]MBF5027266.1 6-carboxytetrahydropterin synthase [Planobacterium oryzisoli]
MIRITKIFTFESAHVLHNYDGKCKNMHGHSYKLFVTVKGAPIADPSHPKNGMVVDFSDIKKIVQEEIISQWDHGVLVNATTEHKKLGQSLELQGHNVIFAPFQPTCEMMLYAIAEKISRRLDPSLELVYLKLHETENSYGEWFASDQKTN